MEVALSKAKARLTDLVKQVEAGEEVILTRHGKPTVRLVPIAPTHVVGDRRRIIEEIQREAAKKLMPGPSAARSQDFLYDEFGLPK